MRHIQSFLKTINGRDVQINNAVNNVDKSSLSVRFAAAENWFKPPMFFIDRTKAVILHFLEKSFK